MLATMIFLTCVTLAASVNFPLWASTGFSPPEPHTDITSYTSRRDVRHLVTMIGALPYANHTFQIRIHWLLDMVKVTQIEGSAIEFDFADLDSFVQYLYEQNVRLGFEMMGNPSNVFTDFENTTQLVWWYNLTYEIGNRYQDKAVPHRWNFESWNEPDHHDFDGLNFTTQGFLNYLSATEKGLHDASPALIFGGPAASCRLTLFSRLCWSSLFYIAYNDTQRGRLDFLSFHKKGSLHSTPPGSAQYMYDSELETLQYMRKVFPRLANVTVYNDEADPVKGWSDPAEFRADIRYPAMVARILHLHAHSPDPEIRLIRMLSNDNAFLGYRPHYFTQRTLVARFLVNLTNDHQESLLVKKPIFDFMSMLSFMRGDWMNIEHTVSDKRYAGVLASLSDKQDSLSVLIYASNDTELYNGPPINVSFTMPSRFAYTQFSGFYLNPHTVYDIWVNLRKPENLTAKELHQLWSHPSMLPIYSISNCKDSFSNSLRSQIVYNNVFERILKPPAIYLYNFYNRFAELSTPYNLTLSCIGDHKVMLAWQDGPLPNRFETYEIHYKAAQATSYVRLTSPVIMARVYHIVAVDKTIAGSYKVRSRGRTEFYSSFSNVAYLNDDCTTVKP